MKKALKILGILLLILFVFKGPLYRLLTNYEQIGTRNEINVTNPDLIKTIEQRSSEGKIDLDEIMKISRSITTEVLVFTSKKVSNDPNELIKTRQANCIGYSAMFNSIANHLINKKNLGDKYKASHRIGKINLIGVNLHQFFKGSFFQEHDFNQISDLETGKVLSIDPSLSDYFWINRVTSSNGE